MPAPRHPDLILGPLGITHEHLAKCLGENRRLVQRVMAESPKHETCVSRILNGESDDPEVKRRIQEMLASHLATPGKDSAWLMDLNRLDWCLLPFGRSQANTLCVQLTPDGVEPQALESLRPNFPVPIATHRRWVLQIVLGWLSRELKTLAKPLSLKPDQARFQSWRILLCGLKLRKTQA